MIFKKTAVKLLILNYNSRSFLKRSIASLMEQNFKGSFEIIVIDNCSTDNSLAYLKTTYPKISVIKNKKNLGVGEGFNRAIKKIINSTDFIAFFNPDIIVDNNWLTTTVSTLKINANADVCAGLILDWKGNVIENAGGTIVNIFMGIFGGFLSGLKKSEMPEKYQNKTFPVFFGVLTAMLVRADSFRRVGYFDDQYFMSSEEADFCWRVHEGGRDVLCNSNAIIKHFGHGSKFSQKMSLFVMRQTEINILLTYYKNLSTIFTLFILPPLFFIRLFFSIAYFLFSKDIALAKLEGIFLFAKNLITGKYFDKKRRVQKMRNKNDFFVFSKNPTNLFSIIPIARSLSSWFAHLKR